MGLKRLLNRTLFKTRFLVNGAFTTKETKPVTADEYKALSDVARNRNKVAIVLQGPLKTDWNFTIETIKIYKKNFAGCILIVSTWETENPDALKTIENLGAVVVRNTVPGPSFLNMNHQIISTIAGLRCAKQMGAQYVLKTRTDQRLYETNIPEFLINIMKQFPLRKKIHGQKHRLITTSFNTFKYRLYEPSDMFLFGDVDDVINYWSCPCVEKYLEINHRDLIGFCKMRPAEIYFFTNFLERTGRKIQWTLADSWDAYAERLAIVDTVSVGLYWPKCSADVNRFRNFYGKNNILEEFTFKEWLDLYLHNGTKEYIPEYYVQNNAFGWDAQIPLKTEIFTDGCPEISNLLKKFNLSCYTVNSVLSDKTSMAIYSSQQTPIVNLKKSLANYNIPTVYLTTKKSDAVDRLCQKYNNLYIVPFGENMVYDLANLRLLLLDIEQRHKKRKK